MKICHGCKRELTFTTAISRREVCPFCRADLHCCYNCAFYDPKASRACREPIAEPVKDKHKANFCDFFTFLRTAAVSGEQEADIARKRLDDLFK